MSEVFRTIIVPEPYAALAASIAVAAAETGGGMFQTALAPAGGAVPTHRISSGWMDAVIPQTLLDAPAAHAVCLAAGHYVPLAHCEALAAAVDVSDEEPHAAMARRGLVLAGAEAEESE